MALADVDPRALERAADRWGIARRYTSTEELVADPDVQAIAVCLPPDLHAAAAIVALESGKHVLVEKPLAHSLEDAERIVRAGREAEGLVATVGFNLRWHRLVVKARELLRGGVLGRIVAIESSFTDPIAMERALPAWRASRRTGGGALFDKGIHHFDLWRFLLGDEVVDVSAMGSARHHEDDTVLVTARSQGGVVAKALLSDVTSTRHELTVFGERNEVSVGLYRFDGLSLTPSGQLPGSPSGRVRAFRQTIGALPQAVRDQRHGGDVMLSYDEQWRSFAAAVTGRERPESSLEDGHKALEIAFAAAESLSTGVTVQLSHAKVLSE